MLVPWRNKALNQVRVSQNLQCSLHEYDTHQSACMQITHRYLSFKLSVCFPHKLFIMHYWSTYMHFAWQKKVLFINRQQHRNLSKGSELFGNDYIVKHWPFGCQLGLLTLKASHLNDLKQQHLWQNVKSVDHIIRETILKVAWLTMQQHFSDWMAIKKTSLKCFLLFESLARQNFVQ